MREGLRGGDGGGVKRRGRDEGGVEGWGKGKEEGKDEGGVEEWGRGRKGSPSPHLVVHMYV